MKVLYELGYLGEDGTIVRGGVKATIPTIGRWIDKYIKEVPEIVWLAVPAGEKAVTIQDARR